VAVDFEVTKTKRRVKFKLSLQDVQELLVSPGLERVETQLANATGKPVLETTSAMRHLADLSVSGLSKLEFLAILESYSEQLGTLAQKVQEFKGLDEEEYSEGEAPDAEELSGMAAPCSLGYERGFGLLYACYLHFLKENDQAKFIAYLKARRIPAPKKFYQQLRNAYESIEKT
jgi:hypothetical protein